MSDEIKDPDMRVFCFCGASTVIRYFLGKYHADEPGWKFTASRGWSDYKAHDTEPLPLYHRQDRAEELQPEHSAIMEALACQ